MTKTRQALITLHSHAFQICLGLELDHRWSHYSLKGRHARSPDGPAHPCQIRHALSLELHIAVTGFVQNLCGLVLVLIKDFLVTFVIAVAWHKKLYVSALSTTTGGRLLQA